MPVLDGPAATRSIRALQGWATRPIIGLTANAFSEDRETCLRAGMNDFVAKPVEPDVLFEALLRWLPKRGAEAEPSAAQEAIDEASAGALESRLRQLAGVDAAYGLRLLNGKAALYARVLREFARQSQPEMESIRARLSAGEPIAALPMIHSLKGAAGSIGAAPLHALLAELELAIRQSRSARIVEELGSKVLARGAELMAAIHALDRG
jgi:two-component system sensor histidine kinase/response regulator